MSLFKKQFSNVVEWQETTEELIFWKWTNEEIKKGSRLVIRPGQDAVFLFDGKIEGVFKDEGNYEIESQIIPFLSTLKGFRFGFNSGMRAEVLFVNTKEFTVKWGTRNSVNIPHPTLPGGLPIRAFGNFHMKVADHLLLIDSIAGVKQSFSVDELRDRLLGILNQLLMKWIVKEGKDLFNLQANAYEIAQGMQTDLDMELRKLGMTVTGLEVASFNYPKEVQDKIDSAAGYGMVGDMQRYQMGKLADSMTMPGGASEAGSAMGAGFGLAAGMKMAESMMQPQSAPQASHTAEDACTKCGTAYTPGAKFCPGCGEKIPTSGFCTECGAQTPSGARFCASCGKPLA